MKHIANIDAKGDVRISGRVRGGLDVQSQVNSDGFYLRGGAGGELLPLEVRHADTSFVGSNISTLTFDEEYFYLTAAPTTKNAIQVNLRDTSTAIMEAQSMTVVEPERRETLTWFVAEADMTVKRLDSWLRAKDLGFYPYADFSVRFGSDPTHGAGVELTTDGFKVGFYPNNPLLTNNPLAVSSFDSPDIFEGEFVWIDVTDIGEGNGIEEELHVTLRSAVSLLPPKKAHDVPGGRPAPLIAIVGAARAKVGGVGPQMGGAYLFDPANGSQLYRLTAEDAAPGDEFGWSVAVSGYTAIVGAYGDDDNGSNSGSAYIFDTTTGTQTHKLTASDAAGSDFFGYSVAISGTTAIIGARDDNDTVDDSGSAYIFNAATGDQLHKLVAGDPIEDAAFGKSVAISGTTAIVGAYDRSTSPGNGAAYLFDTTTGTQTYKLEATDGAAGDQFGWSVAISGTTAIVGAPGDDDAVSGSGSAYIFDTTTGTQTHKLNADVDPFSNLGYSVAISGTTAVVGAWQSDDDGNQSGSAYIFDTTTGDQLAKYRGFDAYFGLVGARFGSAAAISGTTAFVGAQYDNSPTTDAGSAYLFDTTKHWPGNRIARIDAPDQSNSGWFGISVALNNYDE